MTNSHAETYHLTLTKFCCSNTNTKEEEDFANKSAIKSTDNAFVSLAQQQYSKIKEDTDNQTTQATKKGIKATVNPRSLLHQSRTRTTFNPATMSP